MPVGILRARQVRADDRSEVAGAPEKRHLVHVEMTHELLLLLDLRALEGAPADHRIHVA